MTDKRKMPTIKEGMSRHFYTNNQKDIDSQKIDDIDSVEVHEDFSRYKGQGRWLFKDDGGRGFDAEATIKMLDECILWLREKIESDSKSILHV